MDTRLQCQLSTLQHILDTILCSVNPQEKLLHGTECPTASSKILMASGSIPLRSTCRIPLRFTASSGLRFQKKLGSCLLMTATNCSTGTLATLIQILYPFT